jgi:carboxymethylenebutenolidase
MCHDDGSLPPRAPDAVEALFHREVTLEGPDGNRFAAYIARAAEPTGQGVVILPDVRGLHEFYRQLAVRFAEVGADAVAIDYFGRTAGIGDRSEAFEYTPHVQQTTPEGIASDVGAAVAMLRSADGGGAQSVFTVGFCFGGSHSWRQSAMTPGLAGTIGFYGRPQLVEDVVEQMRAPLLMLVAGADANIDPTDVQRLAERVRERGIEAGLVVYEGAPHSFFDRSFTEHRQACDDAWRRIREFLAAHTATSGIHHVT